ncbi:MAG: phosphoribosyl-AMP cyclohydrolase [Candidatus Firestonebacteria bacterium]
MIKIKFDKNGLISVIIQDYKNKDVLMLAYMNKKAFDLTLKTRKVHFYSRRRKKIWLKGEISKHFQVVKGIYFDCDADAILIMVRQEGEAACHTGYRSCFYRKIGNNKKIVIIVQKVFNPREVYK